jgi:hypothetical protein
LSARPIEGQHQLTVEVLVQRVLGDELLELRDKPHVTAECQLGLDPLLDGCQADLLETRDRDLRERLRGEVGEWRSPPEVERILEEAGCGPRIPSLQRSGRLLRAMLEALQIELLGGEPNHVARRASLDRRRTESLPELGNLPLHLGDSRDGGRSRVQVVGESLDRDDAIRVEKQDRQRRALLRPAERHRPIVSDHLERPQDAELEHAGGP